MPGENKGIFGFNLIWQFGISAPLEPLAPFACELGTTFQQRVFIGEPLLHVDGKPPGGLACASFGLSRGSALNPFEPPTATQLVSP